MQPVIYALIYSYRYTVAIGNRIQDLSAGSSTAMATTVSCSPVSQQTRLLPQHSSESGTVKGLKNRELKQNTTVSRAHQRLSERK